MEQWLKVELHKSAVQRRKEAAENGTILKISTILEKHFGDQFEIKNINEDDTYSSIGSDVYKENLVDDYGNHFQESILANALHHLCYNILIRFAEITITNSSDDNHLIKDLYVLIHCDHTGKFISIKGSYMKGIRATVTKSEAFLRYAHSHLPGTIEDRPEFAAFCLGKAPIADVFSDLNEGFDTRKFELLLFYIKAFVVWESIEGTPFKHIGDFQNLTGGTRLPDIIKISTSEVKEYVIATIKRFSREQFVKMFDITMDNSGFAVSLTEPGYDDITKILQDSECFNIGAFFSVKDIRGQFIRFDSQLEDDDTNYQDGHELFRFGNKMIKYKIECNDDNTIKPKIYPNPLISDAICAYFSDELYRKYLQRSTF